MLRRTPCIGTCSTTYGDLVCRGCKRFAHEIVQWNGYDTDQRGAVWQRLLELRAGAVAAVLQILDAERLRGWARRLGLAAADEPGYAPENLLYETLQRLQWREPPVALDDLGVAVAEGAGVHLEPVPESLLAVIDREFYLRSVALYERSYRIPAR
jgi:uncharacterized protein